MSEPLVLAPPLPRARPRGWWGMALFVGTEATLFGTIVGTYFYLRVKSVHWPPSGIPEPKVVVPLILAGVLLSTSAPMQLASRAAAADRARPARALLLTALIVQSGYLAMQLQLYVDDVRALPPELDAYASITHLMVGAGHFHVLVGILLNLFLVAKLLDGRITAYRLGGIRAATLYWHFVNLLTLVLTGVQISPAL